MVDFASYAPAFLDLVAGIGGNVVAEGQYADALDRQTELQREGLEELRTGKREAVESLRPLRGELPGAMRYHRAVMAHDPTQLTPAQRYMERTAARRDRRTNQSSGLSGAGRAGIALQQEARDRRRAGYYDRNQGRADSAAGVLAGVGERGTTGTANAQLGAASNIATQLNRIGGTEEAGGASRGASTLGIARTGADALGRIVGRAYEEAAA